MYPYGEGGDVVSLPHSDSRIRLFDHVVSSPLDEEARARKLLALEAMHDIRLAPRDIDGAWLDDYLPDFLVEAVGPDQSFFRKAVRPNEMFYVIDKTNVGEYFEAYIEIADRRGPYGQ